MRVHITLVADSRRYHVALVDPLPAGLEIAVKLLGRVSGDTAVGTLIDGVVAANVLLGVNQGLTWSTTIIMKIDLVGPAKRGLAMGFNEAAGNARQGNNGGERGRCLGRTTAVDTGSCVD